VLSKVLPSTISSLPRHSVNSQRLSLFRKLQSQLEDGFHGMTSFASVMLVNDSSLFHQSREDILFLRAVLGTLLLLQPSFSASIQAAIDDLDSCFHMTEAPFDLRSAAVPSLSCVVLIRAMVSICETAERHRISIELRKSPSRSVLWALTEVAKKGGMVVSPSQLKFLNDAVVELGCCYEQHVSARMLDAAGIVALLLKELKMSDMATASNETRSSFLNCLAAFADKCDGQESLPSVVLQATKSAISSCPYYLSSSICAPSEISASACLYHSKTGHVSLPYHEGWRCIEKLSGNVKLLMQVDLCCQVLKLVPAFHQKTSREIEAYLCKSHSTSVIRNVRFALDQVNQGCAGIMGMLTSCGHSLAKVLSPDSDTLVDGSTVVSFDASEDDGVFPLLVHVVLARLRGSYKDQSCACTKAFSSVFNETQPSTHAILSEIVSGNISNFQSCSSTSPGESLLHALDAALHLADFASQLCRINHLSAVSIPVLPTAMPDKHSPSSYRRHELYVSNSKSQSRDLFEASSSSSSSVLDSRDLVIGDAEIDSAADDFIFSSNISNFANNFMFFLFYGERGTGKTFQSIEAVKRIEFSRKSRGLRFHWQIIDCKTPENARSSFIHSARMDVNIRDKVDLRAPPHEVAAALSKYLEDIS
jgi:hypothetical protein